MEWAQISRALLTHLFRSNRGECSKWVSAYVNDTRIFIYYKGVYLTIIRGSKKLHFQGRAHARKTHARANVAGRTRTLLYL